MSDTNPLLVRQGPGMAFASFGPPVRGEVTPDQFADQSNPYEDWGAEEQDDGSVELSAPDGWERPDPRDLEHDANLAEVLEDSVLNAVAAELLEGIEEDVASNAEVYEVLHAGMTLLGLKPGKKIDKPIDNSPSAEHPLLLEAALRFNATTTAELLPASGPARCKAIGDSSPDQDAKVQRKQDWLNYYLTEVDEDYEADFDQMVWLLGLYGSMFRIVWRDPERSGLPTSRYLTPYDLVTSAGAQNLAGPWRVTRFEPTPRSTLKRLQLKGWYTDVQLVEPSGEGEAVAPAAEFKQYDFRTPSSRPEDAEHWLLHCHCVLDLAGLEHLDAKGEPTGLPLPYVVTIDADTRKVIRIARNWAPGDTDFRSREYFVHYRYAPGMGFLGMGLIHVAGVQSETLTIARRQALMSFMFASFPGGLKSRGVKADKNILSPGPGEFSDVDTGGQDIRAAVMPLPYRDVPASYPVVMQEMLDSARRVAGVADMQVGDGRQDAPVGTTIALIEAATKVESAVVKRLHRAQRKELRLLADLFGADHQATYPYAVGGRQGTALAQDFGNNADVFPVADPNVPTYTQRLAQAQAEVTLAAQSGGKVDMGVALQNFFRAMGRSDAEIQRLMPGPQQAQPADPVTEFQAVLKGMPLAAGPQQDHQAHIECHMGQLAAPGLKATPAFPALVAHIADHLGQYYRQQACLLLGIPLPPPGTPLPPEVENQIAAAVARASAQLRQQLMQLAPAAQGGDPNEARKLDLEERKLAAAQQDQDRKAQETARQDQVELIKLHESGKQADADRKSGILQAAMKLEHDRLALASEHHQQHRDHAHELGIAALGMLHDRADAHMDRAHERGMQERDHVHEMKVAAQAAKVTRAAAKDVARP